MLGTGLDAGQFIYVIFFMSFSCEFETLIVFLELNRITSTQRVRTGFHDPFTKMMLVLMYRFSVLIGLEKTRFRASPLNSGPVGFGF